MTLYGYLNGIGVNSGLISSVDSSLVTHLCQIISPTAEDMDLFLASAEDLDTSGLHYISVI